MRFDGFIGPSYTLESPSAACQRALNIYLETNEGGPRKENAMRFRGTPGLRKLATLGDGPVRGVYFSTTGQLFVVSGSNLWEVTSAWGTSLRTGSLASSSGRVTMADNGVHLVIGDGGAQAYYSALAFGSSIQPLPTHTLPGGYVTWQDGYFVNSVPNTNQFQISAVNSIFYDPTDVASKEGRPDNIVTLISTKRQLWLFGAQTTEVWWNSGDADFPFARQEGGFIETGVVSAASVARVADSVAWVGNDERGHGSVWYAQGLQPMRISTHSVEEALEGYSNLSQAFAFAYHQVGHEFYQLTVPASSTDNGGTWVFDFATKQWHERSYLTGTGEQPHRASCATVAFGTVVVGDSQDGRLYTYDLSYFSDDTQPIRRMRQAPHISKGEKRIRFDAFELQTEPGVGLTIGQGQNPIATLSWSNDGGHTWGNGHEASMGAEGEYLTRVKWRRLGVSRDRVFRVETSEPVPVTWLGAELDLMQLGR